MGAALALASAPLQCGSFAVSMSCCCPHCRAHSRHSECQVCRRGWPAPKNIRHVNLSGNPLGISFQTKDMIVAHLTTVAGKPGAPAFPSPIFKRLTFAVPPDGTNSVVFREGTLVEYFHYDRQTGDIFHHPGSIGHSSDGYARLITLNWWWIVLQKAVLQVGLGIFEISTTASFVFTLFMGMEEDELDPLEKWLFLLIWCLTILFLLMLSLDEARKEWNIKCHPRVGDVSQHPDSLSSWHSFLALACFMFFGMETIVRDIVVTLHPWKSLQPYAAIKFEGTRAYLLGYDSDEHYMVWNWSGQHRVLPARVLSLLVVIALKGLIFYQSGFSNWLFAWNVFATFISLVNVLKKWFTLHRARVHYRRAHPQVFREVSEHGVFSQKIHTTASKDEEQEVWREHAFVLSHWASSHTVCKELWAPELDGVCTGCRRKPLSADGQKMSRSAVTFAKGAFVRLADHCEEFADAMYGPLRKADIGEVVDVGQPGVGWGARVLVRPLSPDGNTRQGSISITAPVPLSAEWLDCSEWWYDAAALLPVDASATLPLVRIASDADADKTDAVEAPDAVAKPLDRITISTASDALLRDTSAANFAGYAGGSGPGRVLPPPCNAPGVKPLDMPTEHLPLADALQQLSKWAVEFDRQARAIGARLRREHDHDSHGYIRDQVCPLLLRTTMHLILDDGLTIEEHPELTRAVAALCAAVSVSVEAATQTELTYLGLMPDRKPARTPSPASSYQASDAGRHRHVGSSTNDPGRDDPLYKRLSADELEYWRANARIPEGHRVLDTPMGLNDMSKLSPSNWSQASMGKGAVYDTPLRSGGATTPSSHSGSDGRHSGSDGRRHKDAVVVGRSSGYT